MLLLHFLDMTYLYPNNLIIIFHMVIVETDGDNTELESVLTAVVLVAAMIFVIPGMTVLCIKR